MRPGPLILLMTLSLPAAVQAEQSPPQPASAAQVQIDSLEQRLAISEEQRDAMAAELQANDGERESVQLQRLRQPFQIGPLRLGIDRNRHQRRRIDLRLRRFPNRGRQPHDVQRRVDLGGDKGFVPPEPGETPVESGPAR